MQQTGSQHFTHHGAHAPGTLEGLTEIFACRLHIDQKRQCIALLLPILDRQLDTGVSRDRGDVRRGIGRATNAGVHTDCIFKSLPGQHAGGSEIFRHHFNGTPARGISHLHSRAERCGDCGTARQTHAERLGERIHGRGGAHRIAMTKRRRRGTDTAHEFLIVDLAFRKQPAAFPNHRAGTCQLATPPTIEHRPAREYDGRNIDRRRAHEHGGGRLITARRQDNAVNRIAMQYLDKREIGQIAIKGGSGTYLLIS